MTHSATSTQSGSPLPLPAAPISAREAAEAAIARAEAVNPAINAIQAPDFERALKAADNPAPGLLSGVPTFVKDNTEVEGLTTDQGSLAVKSRAATAHAPFTEQFLSAGFTVLGKSTMPEFGFNASTEYATLPPTRNPWNTGYSAGASSGGAAALVASGVVPIAHANDGGGSIRIPAAACGLVGLKPTRGRVVPAVEAAKLPVDIVSNGVVTRSVRDTAHFMAATQAHTPAAGHARAGARRRTVGSPPAHRPDRRLRHRRPHRRRHPQGRRAHRRTADLARPRRRRRRAAGRPEVHGRLQALLGDARVLDAALRQEGHEPRLRQDAHRPVHPRAGQDVPAQLLAYAGGHPGAQALDAALSRGIRRRRRDPVADARLRHARARPPLPRGRLPGHLRAPHPVRRVHAAQQRVRRSGDLAAARSLVGGHADRRALLGRSRRRADPARDRVRARSRPAVCRIQG